MPKPTEQYPISGPDEALRPEEDYRVLRRLGLDAIIESGSEKWTDYNEHDPGITILEVLSYALTDLAYRTNFPIEDILAQQGLHSDQLARQQFYTARHILTSNPLSLTDFRKLIIDIEGVDNAWILPARDSFEPTRGLLDIRVDPGEKLKTDEQRHKLSRKIEDIFHRHRNLSQDLGRIWFREPLEVSFFIEVVIPKTALAEKTVAEILNSLEKLLSSAARFCTFQEMIEKYDGDINRVFQGPPLIHGFLPDDALEPAIEELKTVALIPQISALESVIKVRELKFRTSANDTNLFRFLGQGTDWAYTARFSAKTRPVLAPLDQHQIIIRKGDATYHWSRSSVALEWKALKNKQRAPKLSPAARDISIPEGRFRDLMSYPSIQEDFPAIYGLQPHGSGPEEGTERKAQVKQLKAYLLIFDQILANYLAQLSHLADLFSWSSEVSRTYFFQGLESSVEALKDLLVDADTGKGSETPEEKEQKTLAQYLKKLAELREEEKGFLERRNKFLDHLLARFGRGLHLYTGDLKKEGAFLQNEGEEQGRIEKETKERILQNYDKLSAERGRGFNLRQESATFPMEFSGLRSWVEALFDMEPESLDTLRFNNRFIEGDFDTDNPDKAPVSEFVMYTEDGSPIDMKELIRIGVDPENYQITAPTAEEKEAGTGFELSLFKLQDLKRKSKLYRLTPSFPTAEETLAAIDNLVKLLRKYSRTSERIYLLEHFLLRPYPEEPLFGLELLQADGSPWMHSSNWYAKNDIKELERMISQGYCYYSIEYPAQPDLQDSGTAKTPGKKEESEASKGEQKEEETAPTARTTVDQGKDGPTNPVPPPEKSVPKLSRFQFSILPQTGERCSIRLIYGAARLPIQLETLQEVDSVRKAQKVILHWVRSLAKFTFSIHQNKAGLFQLRLSFGSPEAPIMLHSMDLFESSEKAEALIIKWEKTPSKIDFFSFEVEKGRYVIRFVYQSSKEVIRFQSRQWFDTEAGALKAKAAWEEELKQEEKRIPDLFQMWRPLLKPWGPKTGKQQNGKSPLESDPYSFVLTAVVPDWPGRFQKKGFREALEKTLTEEAPSHLWINILWLNKADFQHFLFLYGNWWRSFNRKESGTAYFRRILTDFLLSNCFAEEKEEDE